MAYMTAQQHLDTAQALLQESAQLAPDLAVAAAARAQAHSQLAATLLMADQVSRTVQAIQADQARKERAEQAQRVYVSLGQVEQPRP